MVKKEDVSTIQLSEKTKKQLKTIGKMGETYEDVIIRLIEHYKKTGS